MWQKAVTPMHLPQLPAQGLEELRHCINLNVKIAITLPSFSRDLNRRKNGKKIPFHILKKQYVNAVRYGSKVKATLFIFNMNRLCEKTISRATIFPKHWFYFRFLTFDFFFLFSLRYIFCYIGKSDINVSSLNGEGLPTAVLGREV